MISLYNGSRLQEDNRTNESITIWIVSVLLASPRVSLVIDRLVQQFCGIWWPGTCYFKNCQNCHTLAPLTPGVEKLSKLLGSLTVRLQDLMWCQCVDFIRYFKGSSLFMLLLFISDKTYTVCENSNCGCYCWQVYSALTLTNNSKYNTCSCLKLQSWILNSSWKIPMFEVN